MALKRTCPFVDESIKSLKEEKVNEPNSAFLAFSKSKVWKYDVKSKELCIVQDTKFNHYSGSAIKHNDKVYVISASAVERLDLDNTSSGWIQLSSPIIQREETGCVVCNDFMFTAAGSYDGYSCEKYSFENDKWTEHGHIIDGRCGNAMATTGGLLYVIGGWDGSEVKTVECQDPREGFWYRGVPMKEARQWFPAVVLNGEIYAIGGSNDSVEKLRSVERFDPVKQTWSNVGDMQVARSCHGACVIEQRIYVAGGNSSAIEAYDPTENAWTIVGNVETLKDAEFIVAI